MARLIFRLFIAGCVTWMGITAASAQGGGLIRDSEIEDTIRLWANPLFVAAGIDPYAARLYLVNDPRLNAFVAGGQNIFLHTGLLIASEGPGEVKGVMAHEIGHIAGGHLARHSEGLEAAQDVSFAHILLGLGILALGAAAGATGDAARAGGAVIAGGQAAGLRSYLGYTRTQENSADQAGLQYLDRTGQSAAGLHRFLGKLLDQELLVAARQDPYLRTHPLTRDRLGLIEQHLQTSRFSDVGPDPDDIERHARMRAKLVGYLWRPARVLRDYPPSDISLPGRYARSVAYWRSGDLNKAFAELDSLIAERPGDPYFAELKGEIYLDHGRLQEAMEQFGRADQLRPNDPLILTALAQVQIEMDRREMTVQAISNAENAARVDAANPSIWRVLAIGHGRLGNLGQSSLAGAELALLRGLPDDVELHADRAQRHYPEGSPGWLRAQDMRDQAHYLRQKMKRRR